MKKNNTAEKTAQDAKKLTEALKESANKSLKEIMTEALSDIINDDEEETEVTDEPETDEVEDTNEVNDVETEDDNQPEDNADNEAPEEEAETGEEGDAIDNADDEWSDMEDFKVGDNDYDFTGVDGETALKVYNKLGDDDQIVVKKEDDGTYTVSDEETGAEYVIELNADTDETEADVPEIGDDEDDNMIDIEIGDDTEDGDDENAIDIEIEDENEDDEENLDEDANFVVDDYQKGDAIQGLKMNEPANKKNTYSMDAGAPEGTERPYAKKIGDGDPFEKNVNECGGVTEEVPIEEDGSGLNTKHATKKNTNHINRSAQNQRNVSTDGKFEALKEAAQKIYKKAKLIQEENNKYKGYIADIKKSLTEAAVLNVSLTQALKLMCENSTTASEKRNIITRFNNVKSLKECKELYNTIKTELNESKKTQTVLTEKQFSAEPEKKTLNETTVYKNPCMSLVERMDNISKNNIKFM